MQTGQVFPVLVEILTLRGLDCHGVGSKAWIVEQRTEAFQPQCAMTDVFVPVHPAAELLFRVIEMEKAQVFTPDNAVKFRHGAII